MKYVMCQILWQPMSEYFRRPGIIVGQAWNKCQINDKKVKLTDKSGSENRLAGMKLNSDLPLKVINPYLLQLNLRPQLTITIK